MSRRGRRPRGFGATLRGPRPDAPSSVPAPRNTIRGPARGPPRPCWRASPSAPCRCGGPRVCPPGPPPRRRARRFSVAACPAPLSPSGTLEVILTAFRARDGDAVPGGPPVEEHRRSLPAGPVGYPRDPVGHDLDDRIRGVLYGEVLDGLHTGPGGTLHDVVVDLAYLLEVGYVLLSRTTHRRTQSPDVETRAVHVLVGEVDHERAHVRVVAVAVEDDLGHQVNPLDHEVRPLFEAPVHDGLYADGDLGGLLSETEEDHLVFLDRHPQVLTLYVIGALVQQREQVGAYGAPQDLPDRISTDHALDVEAPGNVGGERARPYPRRPADQDDYGLGRLPEHAPFVEPPDDEGILLDQLVPDAGEDLLRLERVDLLGQELGAYLARYLVRQLGARPGLRQGLRQNPPGERRLPAPLDNRDLPLVH